MQKVVVAITGASGAIYASRLLNKIISQKENISELSLVMTDNARTVWETELGNKEYDDLPLNCFRNNDFYAPFASGSAGYKTMIIVPCSMGMLGRIANGISDDLISRAADVILKERGKLICVARETPLNLVHLKNMEMVTLAGGIICPAVPSFYSRPLTVEEVADTVVNRVLDLAGLPAGGFRWGEH